MSTGLRWLIYPAVCPSFCFSVTFLISEMHIFRLSLLLPLLLAVYFIGYTVCLFKFQLPCITFFPIILLFATSYFHVTSSASSSQQYFLHFSRWFLHCFALLPLPRSLFAPLPPLLPLVSCILFLSVPWCPPFSSSSHSHPLLPLRCAPLSINSCLLSPVWYLLPWGVVVHVSAGVFWQTGSWPCLRPNCYTGWGMCQPHPQPRLSL